MVIPALEATSGKEAGKDFAVCINPEFMREGSAVADFFSPPFTVLGCLHPDQASTPRAIYSAIPAQIFETSLTAAEMVKYVCNAFHAVKIGFANEIGTLCQYLGCDPTAVLDIFTWTLVEHIALIHLVALAVVSPQRYSRSPIELKNSIYVCLY
jgi:GDP-mannose 6-dehydrogenase